MNVAILGGGVAGLATAISLKRIGIDVSVYERRSSVHNLGAGVVCWPNASFVLDRLQILDELRTVSAPITTMKRITRHGVELGSLDIGIVDSAMGFPSLSVLRKDLMRVLLRRAERMQIPVNLSANAIAIEKNGENCHVHFDNGAFISPDLVVGADGRMSSVTRKFVLNDNRTVYQGFTNWLGIHRFDHPVFDQMEILDFWGVGARFGIVPVSKRTAYWAGGIASSESPQDSRAKQLDKLNEVFREWPAPIGEIVTRAAEATTNYLGLYDHDSASSWHRNNVIMIGDAAHAALPTSGQGVGQAFEDAWWLAHELETSSGDLDAAMTAFTKRRFKKTEAINQTGRRLAKMLFSLDPGVCELRDQNAQETDYEKMAAGMATGWSDGLPIGA